MDPNYISELAHLFRDHGDQVLCGDIKFSVSGQMLRALNDSFSLIVNPRDSTTPPGERSRDFIVTSGTEARSSVFLDLQLIYDFVQILVHVHINHLVTDDDLEASVNLNNFRNLQKLEIQKLPVQKIQGLHRLRNQLRELSCQQCIRSCQDVLLLCGGDRSTEQIWTELRSINFAYNALEQIDDSLRWTPWVHTLNLSHNRLTVTSLLPLKCLPNLKFLDLSYNRLVKIPELATDASRKLQTLKLRGNSIENISEVVNFESLADLDLSANCLLFDVELINLSVLASLRCLNLLGNPMAYNPRHRMTVINSLHSNTSTVKFILNEVPMTKAEKKYTGGFPSYHNTKRQPQLAANTSTSSLLVNVSTLEVHDDKSHYNAMTDSVKKRSKRREILLSDELNDNEDAIVVGSPRRSLSSSRRKITNVDHLETKKQIEELRDKFGSNWLNADGENIVKEVFPREEKKWEDDLIRRRILIDELNDDSILSSTPKEGMASRLEITEEHLSQTSTLENYGTASERTVGPNGTTIDTTAVYESAESREDHAGSSDLTGLDFFQSQHSVEDETPEPNEVEYLVEKLKTAREESGWKLLVVVSDLSIKEKDRETKDVINRWGLTVLESCERPNERNVISIHFNTMRSDKRQRFYLLTEEKECLKLTESLRDILANRDWDEFNQAVYRCANCTTQFCIDRQNQKAAERVKCPECKSFYVIEITESNNNKLKHPTVQKVQSQEQEEKVPMVKSTSHSSIGSAASLNESSSCSKLSNPPTSIDSNESVAGSSTSQRDKDADLNGRRLGMESDVEILSNPSQSSIEVLNSCSKNSSRKHSEERRNIRMGPSGQLMTDELTGNNNFNKKPEVDEKDEAVDGHQTDISDDDNAEAALDVTNIAVANKLLSNHHLHVLTESSSSGSVTESICTQYEHHQPAAVEEHKPVEVTEENAEDPDQTVAGFKKSSSTFFDGFLSASNMLKNLNLGQSIKPADGIRIKKADPFIFSTVHFHQADHRFQLYLHQNVFLESNEKFGTVVRGQLVQNLNNGDNSSDGSKVGDGIKGGDSIIVLSNKNLYLFLVTAEEDDDPGQWLRLMRRVDVVKEWQTLRVLPFEMGVRFCFIPGSSSGGNWNLILQDGQHTRNYVKVLQQDNKSKVDEELCEDDRMKLMAGLKVGGDEEELLFVGPFKALTKIVNEVAQSVDHRSGLVVTSKKFSVISANWTWLLEENGQKPEVQFQLALTDMVECEVKTDTEFVLNFMDERENQHELWCLEFETKYAAQAVLEAIKGPWEKVFDAPLVQK